MLWISTVSNSFSQSFASLVAFVTDKDSGLPISNASIIVKEAGWSSKTTGSDGKAFFDKSMPIGEIHYIVSKEGYQGQEGTFNITTEEKSNTLNIKLTKFQDDRVLITGEVVDENERDLAGATVEVKIADIVKTTKTDQSGNYSIELTLNRTKYDVNSIKLEAKCPLGGVKKSEVIDLTRRNVIYKDFKLNCPSLETTTVENSQSLASQTLDGVKVEIKRFERKGTNLIVHFTAENITSNQEIKSYYFYAERCQIQNQDGVEFYGKRCEIGKKEVGWVNLVSGNITKGVVEFSVGENEIIKAQLLKICFGNNYATFTNVKAK